MKTIKSFTDIPQSKKLVEILPLESADMYWDLLSKDKYAKVNNIGTCLGRTCVYAWSLAALLEILPIDFVQYKHYFLEVSKMGDASKPYEVRYYRFREDWEGADYGRITHISYTADNLIDACVAMIERLHEQKLL